MYVHGVGGVTPLEDWLEPLNVGLAQAGHSPVDPEYDTVVPVTYQSLLLRAAPAKGTRPDEPKDTWEATADEEAERQYALAQEDHATFVRQFAHTARGVHYGHTPMRVSGQLSSVVARVGDLSEARAYASSRTVRAEVVRDVLSQLPSQGSVVLVAHSLGSVIAADVLTKLPPALRVEALVTLGSPLASEMWKHTRPLADAFPYDRVGAWINVYDPRDPITFGRGVGARFPMAVDLAVDIRSHSVRGYAAHPAVGTVLGRLLYGEPVVAGTNAPARALSPGWHHHLWGFAYAEQLSRTCEPKRFEWRRRFDTARRVCATRLLAPGELAVPGATPAAAPSVEDLLDRAADLVRDVWSDDDLVPLAVSAHVNAPLPPFDLVVDPQHRSEALVALFDRVRRRQGSISDTEFAKAVAAGVETATEGLSTDRRRWRTPLVGGSETPPAPLAGAGLWTALGPGPRLLVSGPEDRATPETHTVGALLGLILATGTFTSTDDAAGPMLDALPDAVVDVLGTLPVNELRSLVVAMLAVVCTQESLGLASSRPFVEEVLVEAQSRLAQEAHLHAVVTPKRPATREAAERAELTARAVDLLLAPAEVGDVTDATAL